MEETTISDRINERIEALGVSNETVAGGVGVSVQTIRNWREDADFMRSIYLRPLARVLKCSALYLLGISDEVAA